VRRRRPAAPPACRGSRGAASADVVTVLVAVAAACLRPRAFALPTPGAGASAGRWTRGKRRAREGTEEAGWWVGLGWAKSSPSSGAMRAAGPAGGRMRLRQAAGAPSRAGRDMLPRRPVRSNLGASVRRRPLGRALVCGPLRVLWPVCASRCPASPGALRPASTAVSRVCSALWRACVRAPCRHHRQEVAPAYGCVPGNVVSRRAGSELRRVLGALLSALGWLLPPSARTRGCHRAGCASPCGRPAGFLTGWG